MISVLLIAFLCCITAGQELKGLWSHWTRTVSASRMELHSSFSHSFSSMKPHSFLLFPLGLCLLLVQIPDNDAARSRYTYLKTYHDWSLSVLMKAILGASVWPCNKLVGQSRPLTPSARGCLSLPLLSPSPFVNNIFSKNNIFHPLSCIS